MASQLTPESLDLYWVELDMPRPWVAPTGNLGARPTIIVAAHHDGHTGWGECPALPDSRYDGNTLEGCWAHLGGLTDVESAGSLRGLAAGAWDLSMSDLRSRVSGRRMRDDPRLAIPHDARSVPAGVVVDDVGSVESTLTEVASYVEQGYERVKLKVFPGHDVPWCSAVVAEWPTLRVGVDANGTYSPDDPAHVETIGRLDTLGLAFIEQPYPPDALSDLARLAASIDTPICLDESIRGPESLNQAIDAGAADMISIKWSRVGGLTHAASLAATAAEAGVGAMVGGMIESGVGRTAALLLAAHPAMTMTGDVSDYRRFFTHDLVTDPALMDAGRIPLPLGPGLGVTVDVETVEALSTRHVAIGFG